MNVEITRITKEQEETFLNFYNLYLYDLSVYTGEDPKENGEFDPANTYLYLERDELYPYFIINEGIPIGFVLICSPPFVSEEVNYTIQELFLLKKYRGKNLAYQAIETVLGKHKGTFSISQLEENKPAVRFWKKYYQEHNISFNEEQENIPIEGLEGLHKLITQTFEN